MNRFLNWLVVSSSNPEQFSLTLKGILIANIGVIMFIIHQANLSYTVDQITVVISTFTALVGGILTVIGLLRKMYLSLKKND